MRKLLRRARRSLRRWLHASAERTRGARRREALIRLGRLAEALSGDVRRLDPHFVGMADGLNRIHSGAEALSRTSRRLAESVQERFAQVHFTGDAGCVGRALAEMQGALDSFQQQLASLGDVTASLRELNRHGEAVQKIALALRSSTCSFAVESARTAEGRDSFSDFLINLRQLADRIDNLGGTINDECQRGALDQGRATSELHAGLRQLQEITPATVAVVRGASERVQGALDAARETVVRIGSQVAEIDRHAAAAIYSLQSGDILRQKIEHVIEALARASSSADRHAATGSAPHDEAALDQLVAVQAAQLEAVAAEARSTHERLTQAFDGLGQETNHLLAEIGSLGSADATASLAPLAADIRRLQALQVDALDLTRRSRSSASQAADIADDLTRHLDEVQDVNRELHLHALNAIVKTSWLGEGGATLGVLSSYVHDLSRESTATVDDILRQLEEVGRTARRLKADAAEEETDRAESLESGLHCIEELLTQLPAQAAETDELAAAQLAELEQARAQLEFLPELSARTSALVGELAEIRSAFLRSRRHRRAHAKADAALSSTYTMESEREVHRAVVQRGAEGHRRETSLPEPEPLPAVPAFQPATAGESSGETSTLGDNVELF